MRIPIILLCLALAGPPALARAEERVPTDAEFVGDFHQLCPREARTEDDVERAFVAAGAKPGRTLGALEVQHPAPADFPPGSEVASAKRHWFYQTPRWAGIATTRTVEVGGVRQLHCKVQMSTTDGRSFVWLLQYAAGAAPRTHVFADGSRAYVFQDAATPNAYYLFWHDLPPALPTAKPTSVLEYVTGGPLRPAPFQTPEGLAVSRVADFCLDPDPAQVAANVASRGIGEIDAEARARMIRRADGITLDVAHAWIMNDSEEWRLRASASHGPLSPVRECSLRVAGVHEALLATLLAHDNRWELEDDGPYGGGRARRYRISADRILVYFVSAEADGPMKSHTLSVIAGGPLAIRPARR